MRNTRTTHAIALTAAATLALAGCGGGDGADHGSGHGSDTASSDTASSGADGRSSVNDADRAFTTMMIPHHEQAVDMAELVPDRSDDPAVEELAREISDAQGPEIETMQGWLDDWGVEPMAEGHGGHDMDGMMSEDDMTELRGLSGAEFDSRWLEMMIDHHQGAVDMAEAEIADGSQPEVVDLARTVKDTQEDEIAEMEDMLGR